MDPIFRHVLIKGFTYPCEIFPAVQARCLAELIEHHDDDPPGPDLWCPVCPPLASAHSTRLTEHQGAGQAVHSGLGQRQINSNK